MNCSLLLRKFFNLILIRLTVVPIKIKFISSLLSDEQITALTHAKRKAAEQIEDIFGGKVIILSFILCDG